MIDLREDVGGLFRLRRLSSEIGTMQVWDSICDNIGGRIDAQGVSFQRILFRISVADGAWTVTWGRNDRTKRFVCDSMLELLFSIIVGCVFIYVSNMNL